MDQIKRLEVLGKEMSDIRKKVFNESIEDLKKLLGRIQELSKEINTNDVDKTVYGCNDMLKTIALLKGVTVNIRGLAKVEKQRIKNENFDLIGELAKGLRTRRKPK